MGALLQAMFEAQASRSPDALAISSDTCRLTYIELNGRANQLARLLQQQGIGIESVVGVCLERSVEMVVTLLAVLKAGAAYVPIDPGYPTERIGWMLADAETAVCLTQSALVEKLPSSAPIKTIFLDQSDDILSPLPAENLNLPVSSDNLAYIIYTSGSTGKPKGAMITHRGLANYLEWALAAYPVQEGGAPVHSSIGFDLTVTSLFLPLLAGQPVHLLPEGETGSLLAAALAQPGGFGLVKITPAHLLLLNQLIPPEKANAATRAFVIGGEQLTAEQVAFWRKQAPQTRLFNEYGPTETVVGCCVYEILPGDDFTGAVPIGRPIANTQLHVLDEAMQPVPDGEVGELYVGGAGVARGYLKRPSLTAEKFIPDPFSEVPGARLYRTGDLARLRPDGNYEFLGRIDHQVKIRGYRVELGEIEAVLGQYENVRETAVLTHETSGSKQLIAYWTAEQTPTPSADELRGFLAQHLPDYMIPARFVLLEAMPLTLNGKIDRQALPTAKSIRPELPRPYAPPRSHQEETLANIWAELLDVSPVGIDDNFFGLGGDSILSIQMLVRARQAGLNFTLVDLFNLETIGRLAEYLARMGPVETNGAAADVAPFSLIRETDRANLPPEVEDAYPLSKLQAGMLFHAELAAGTAAASSSPGHRSGQSSYHSVNSFQIEGPFNGEMLETAVQHLAQKYTVLRTSFDLTNYSEPLQLVWPQVQVPVTLLDLRQMDSAAQEAEINGWVQQAIAHKFDWTQPPLLRFYFLQRSATSFQMILADHHAILDGWSVASLVTELMQTYRALQTGQPITVEATIPYHKFVAEEQAALAAEASRAFWRGALAESNVSQVPRLPLPETGNNLPETAVHQIIIPAEQVARLNLVAQQAGVPFKNVLLAAHLKVLGFVCGQDEVVSGLVVNGRPEQSGSERALGLFLNTVPFRQKLAEGSWLDLIRQTFATEKTLLPHRRFPLAEIQQMMGGQPLFEVPFNYLHFHIFDELASDGRLKIVDEQHYGHTNFALAVEAELSPAEGVLALRLEFNPAEFGPVQIERLAGYFERTLAALATEPDAAHHTFSPLSSAELQMLLVDWNATAATVPDVLIHEWVAKVAAERGEKTAVVTPTRQLSYTQLNARANQLAHHLQASGVGPETIVAIFLNRSPEMVIAALAVLKAGAAYLPLDPTYPAERIHYMLSDARPYTIITRSELRTALQHSVNATPDSHLLCLDTDWPKIASCSEQNPDCAVTAENAAYIIYTSGSTGQPKGVVITHRGLPNLAQALHKIFAVGPESRVLQFAAFGFDGAVAEIFEALTAGATLVLAEAEMLLPGPDLAELVSSMGVTTMTLPPSALAILDPAEFPSLQTVVAVGEACSAEVVARWSAGRCFVNGYGPTENTVCATTAVLTTTNTTPPIGRPIDNVQLFILNKAQQPVPVGTPGELYIGGLGVARGYLNRPELTAERFVTLPFNLPPLGGTEGRRVYRTGDLVRYLPDGNVEFLGRLDHQVKLRGYRVELGEIETVLRRQTAVQDALVLAKEKAGTGPQLVAYVVGQNLDVNELRTLLSQRLPVYMVPSAIMLLEAFPLTPNGKIDRNALPEPTATAVAPYVPPRNDVETVMANVWAETLKLPRVGIHDDFFELGGHSLLATQLVARLRQMLRIELPLGALFNASTVAGLTTIALQPPNNRARVEKVAQLLIRLSQLSDEEAAQLLNQKR